MRLPVWTAVAIAAAAAAVSTTDRADAQSRRDQVVYSQPNTPTYMQDGRRGGRPRITIRARSFLDLGTDVAPGERKFLDYAMPPNYSVTAVIDNTAAWHRWPLPGPFDLPGPLNPYLP